MSLARRARAPSVAILTAFGVAAPPAGCVAEKRDAPPDTSQIGTASAPVRRDTAAVSAPIADGDVPLLLALINASESSAGATAARKGTVADVRAFASDMVADHTAMQQSVGADTAAPSPGTTPAGRARADTLRAVSRRQSDSLAALPRGALFDRVYIDQQVSAHSTALDSLLRWAAQVRSPELQRLIGAAIPKVRSHLDRARVIQASLGGMVRGPLGTGPDTTAPSRIPPDSVSR